MAGLFVMLRFIKKRVAPAQFESRLYSTLTWSNTRIMIIFSDVERRTTMCHHLRMFGEGIIPDADIKKYGFPIAICAIQKSSAPGAAALRWNTGRSAWQYHCMLLIWQRLMLSITFMKLS